MTPDEIRTNQRIFEAGGAIACGGIFGLILWMAEVPPELRTSAAGYARLLWWMFVAVSAYASICYLLDRYSERRRWRFRPNWMLIAVVSTTLLFLVGIVPGLVKRRGIHPVHWEEDVIVYAVLLVAMNLLVLCLMFGAWALGFLLRFVKREASYFKVVP